jgi:hypothetical protein
MFETIDNPILKAGIILGGIVIVLVLLQATIMVVRILMFKPRKKGNINERVNYLTKCQQRQKQAINQRYYDKSRESFSFKN